MTNPHQIITEAIDAALNEWHKCDAPERVSDCAHAADAVLAALKGAGITLLEDWRPIETAPSSGHFLAAQFAPTNWAYHVKDVLLYGEEWETGRHREMLLKYCTHWMPRPAAPSP